MAMFVIGFKLSPSEYYNLTAYEREALIKMQQKLNKK